MGGGDHVRKRCARLAVIIWRKEKVLSHGNTLSPPLKGHDAFTVSQSIVRQTRYYYACHSLLDYLFLIKTMAAAMMMKKMAAAKKRVDQVAWQIEVATDEEWDDLMKNTGLIG